MPGPAGPEKEQAEPGQVDPGQGDGEQGSGQADVLTLALRAETVHVTKRVRRTLVRASRTTSTRDVAVDEELARHLVMVERVPVNRLVDEVPPVRQENDVTIMPVVEEELVLVRRLVLKEELHLRQVRTTERHVETVSLREQEATVTRSPLEDGPIDNGFPVRPARPDGWQARKGYDPMSDEMNAETIVAVFDSPAHAADARGALMRAGVPEDAITLHAATENGTAATAGTPAEPPREEGFWSSLFGGSPGHDTSVYDQSMAGGATVVSVRLPSEHAPRVMEILEGYHPIDIDERAASYGLTEATTTAAATTATGQATTEAARPVTPAVAATTAMERDVAAGDTLQLAEEQLVVGKRVVNRGGTRVRRYVVETPVEENVSLHSERVVVERRPVTDGRTVTDSFNEKTIEMTESAEEAVVSKTARVVEEISLRKEGTDREETVRDTVRKEEAEVEQVPAKGPGIVEGSSRTTTGAPGTGTPGMGTTGTTPPKR